MIKSASITELNLETSLPSKFFVMGKMDTSPNLKYDRYGFKKMDESWIQ